MIDAGRKTLSSTAARNEPGFGHVVDRPGVEIHALSEECGWLRSDAPLAVGTRLRVVPNHACELPNLAEVVAHGTDGIIQGAWVPVARGKVW
jgi:D-serine deaminase-like pyridoxal phosphate-dependent protein